MKDLIARSVEQGRSNPPSDTAPFRRRRSELPVARPATGRSLSSLANVDVQHILDDEVEQASREAPRAEARRKEVEALVSMRGTDLLDEE